MINTSAIRRYSINRELLFVVFVLLLCTEDTIRKYLVSSGLVPVAKFIPLCLLCLIGFRQKPGLYKAFSHVFLVISAITLITLPSDQSQLMYAIYDFISLTLVTYSFFAMFNSRLILFNASFLVKLIVGFSCLNSFIIILQSFAGPTHWISQSVDQQFSQHIYSFGSIVMQKSPGILSTSSAMMAILGLTALLGSKPVFNKPLLNRMALLIIVVSPAFNISSRQYVYGVGLYLVIFFGFRLLSFFFKHRKLTSFSSLSFILILSVFAPIVIVFYSYNFDLSSLRLFNSSDSISSRVLGESLGTLFDSKSFDGIPAVFGMGLGASINSNSAVNLSSYCSKFTFGIESEFPRLLCSFGLLGAVIVAFRIIAGLLIILPALQSDFSSKAKSTIYSLRLYIGFNVMMGFPFDQNTNIITLMLAGIFVIAYESNYLEFSPLNRSKQFYWSKN